jgi:hypothetical protein
MEEMMWASQHQMALDARDPIPGSAQRFRRPPIRSQKYRDGLCALYLKQLEGRADTRVDTRLRTAARNLGADVHVNSHPKIRPVLQKIQPGYVRARRARSRRNVRRWRANFEYFRRWVAPR